MFFFNNKRRVTTIKMRDEWGVLHEIQTIDGSGFKQGTLTLTDQELAAQLGVSLTTVETHRRD